MNIFLIHSAAHNLAAIKWTSLLENVHVIYLLKASALITHSFLDQEIHFGLHQLGRHRQNADVVKIQQNLTYK